MRGQLGRTLAIVGMLILMVSFLLPLPAWGWGGIGGAVLDGLHFPAFVYITIVLFWIMGTRRSSAQRTAVAALIALAIVIGVEIVQPFFGRTQCLADGLWGTAGVAIGALGCMLFSGRCERRPTTRAVFAGVTLAIGVAGFWPAIRYWRAEHRARGQFPILGDFESSLDLRIWIPQEAEMRRAEAFSPDGGSASLRLTTNGRGFGGVALPMAAFDWGAKTALVWECNSAATEAFSLGVRVDAEDGNRSSTAVEVRAGKTEQRVLLQGLKQAGRDGVLDLENIVRLVFHTAEDAPPRVFYLDNVRLE